MGFAPQDERAVAQNRWDPQPYELPFLLSASKPEVDREQERGKGSEGKTEFRFLSFSHLIFLKRW